MFKIVVPSSSFEGERCGVTFRKGEGETESREVAEMLAALGYEVEGLEKAKATPKKTATKKKATPKKED
ncbi:hypothetical protein [Bacillus wiedmannii]|uniref:hypothetical protein n=1 Tax=Bacillus wiedmannii TaxID=1890302 RepID=UPI000BEF865A|nr:hypothetical protein [Bacillus wiedmannii]PEJ48433.1 hypothetical protein CN672_13905 [Bacillus wiedmannii]PEM10281.1 hypothetical protein CN610_13925 [Bacillus wiedmannii]PGD08266.1 hypothetical protein COM34_14285 [Bacillus wiedmannii]PHD09535.1 hypothetical protein COF45_17725 [Bacillus wiedmannii]